MFQLFHSFFNTRIGRLDLSYSANGCSLSIAPSINPNLPPNKIQKGQQVYDYEKTIYFTLTAEEIAIAKYVLENLIEKNVDMQPTNMGGVELTFSQEYNTYNLTFKHFLDGSSPTILSIIVKQDRSSISISYYNSRTKQQFHFPLHNVIEGYYILKEWFNNYFVFRTTIIALNKYKNYEQYNKSQQQGSNKQYGGSSYQQNNVPGIAGTYTSKNSYSQNKGYSNEQRNDYSSNQRNYNQQPKNPPPPPQKPQSNSNPFAPPKVEE